MNLSTSEENYIKSIYHLQKTDETVNTNALAKELNTKAASVTDMLKKLKLKKLIQYERYYGFKLNEKGTQTALSIIRRHRLWEYFLVAKLGFDWDKVHIIAEELEHVSSIELIKKLGTYLGNPKIDPHGDPIPDVNGKLPSIKQINLFALPLNKTGVISSVSNQSTQMLEMLNHYGIAIGSQIKINKTFDFDKSLEIKLSKQPACIISEQVAKNIFVYHD
ncbi:MAG: metal-dependent transcriptional regulator [Chitinophagaceae bacterium]|nr:metal-dependent transcriptional regulator [Chitinophagaceae bacterium]